MRLEDIVKSISEFLNLLLKNKLRNNHQEEIFFRCEPLHERTDHMEKKKEVLKGIFILEVYMALLVD